MISFSEHHLEDRNMTAHPIILFMLFSIGNLFFGPNQATTDQDTIVAFAHKAAVRAVNFHDGDAESLAHSRADFSPEGWKDFMKHMEGFIDSKGAPTFTSSFIPSATFVCPASPSKPAKLPAPPTKPRSKFTPAVAPSKSHASNKSCAQAPPPPANNSLLAAFHTSGCSRGTTPSSSVFSPAASLFHYSFHSLSHNSHICFA